MYFTLYLTVSLLLLKWNVNVCCNICDYDLFKSLHNLKDPKG